MLDEESEKRKAAMEAVAKASEKRKAAAAASGGGSLGLASILADEASRPSQPAPAQYDPEPEAPPSEAQLAAEAGKRLGKKVELDDEGRIVDHRQLLSGGLNLGQAKKGPTKERGFALPIAQRAKEDREKLAAQARDEMHEVGEDGMTRAEKIKMSRERQSRMLQAQLIEVEEKKRKAEEDELAEGRKKVSVRRNDESRVEEMRRKAMERRKAREELASSAS